MEDKFIILNKDEIIAKNLNPARKEQMVRAIEEGNPWYFDGELAGDYVDSFPKWSDYTVYQVHIPNPLHQKHKPFTIETFINQGYYEKTKPKVFLYPVRVTATSVAFLNESGSYILIKFKRLLEDFLSTDGDLPPGTMK